MKNQPIKYKYKQQHILWTRLHIPGRHSEHPFAVTVFVTPRMIKVHHFVYLKKYVVHTSLFLTALPSLLHFVACSKCKLYFEKLNERSKCESWGLFACLALWFIRDFCFFKRETVTFTCRYRDTQILLENCSLFNALQAQGLPNSHSSSWIICVFANLA